MILKQMKKLSIQQHLGQLLDSSPILICLDVGPSWGSSDRSGLFSQDCDCISVYRVWCSSKISKLVKKYFRWVRWRTPECRSQRLRRCTCRWQSAWDKNQWDQILTPSWAFSLTPLSLSCWRSQSCRICSPLSVFRSHGTRSPGCGMRPRRLDRTSQLRPGIFYNRTKWWICIFKPPLHIFISTCVPKVYLNFLTSYSDFRGCVLDPNGGRLGLRFVDCAFIDYVVEVRCFANSAITYEYH